MTTPNGMTNDQETRDPFLCNNPLSMPEVLGIVNRINTLLKTDAVMEVLPDNQVMVNYLGEYSFEHKTDPRRLNVTSQLQFIIQGKQTGATISKWLECCTDHTWFSSEPLLTMTSDIVELVGLLKALGVRD